LATTILHDYHEQLPGGITLEPGNGGVYEIFYNDTPVFSKIKEGRFPDEDEAVQLVEHALGMHGGNAS
jgi:selT/selW/selH-like putative selenoprotein